MNLSIGDTVMHWTYGLGRVVGLEERELSGSNTLYYAVRVRDMTVWVPADEDVKTRLRMPTTKKGFESLFAILSAPGEGLPEDRQERKLHVAEILRDGKAESLCRVIRDLSAFGSQKPLNENDHVYFNRAFHALMEEWSFSLAVPETEAAKDMNSLLNVKPVEGGTHGRR